MSVSIKIDNNIEDVNRAFKIVKDKIEPIHIALKLTDRMVFNYCIRVKVGYKGEYKDSFYTSNTWEEFQDNFTKLFTFWQEKVRENNKKYSFHYNVEIESFLAIGAVMANLTTD